MDIGEPDGIGEGLLVDLGSCARCGRGWPGRSAATKEAQIGVLGGCRNKAASPERGLMCAPRPLTRQPAALVFIISESCHRGPNSRGDVHVP